MQGSLFIIGILVGGFVTGALARMVIPGVQRLTWSETTLAGIAGAAVGGFITNLVRPDTATTSFGWGTGLGAFAGTLMVVGIATLVMNRFKLRTPVDARQDASELIAAGENHQVEFKSTARWNVHTEQRDPKIELAIAKTVAGFLNSDGGTLLVGVTDEGFVGGLGDDLKLMKAPDLDRYELWLADHLERCLGKPSLSNVRVAFELVENNQVCRVDVDPSPAPVFLDEPGGNREADMYVRMGNSTRKLLTDEALEYSRQHW